MPRKYWIINHCTKKYLETETDLDKNWKDQFPHTKDEPWVLVSAISVWDDQRTANGIYYTYELSRDGGHFLLLVDKDTHSPDDVKVAKAELRQMHDVVSLKVGRYSKAEALPRPNNQKAAGYVYAMNQLDSGAKINDLRRMLNAARLDGTYGEYHSGVAKALVEFVESKITTAIVIVTQSVPDSEFDWRDEDVAGRYEVSFHEAMPNDLAANAALDVFHTHIPIEVLDNFNICVEGLEQRPDIPSYLLGKSGAVDKLEEG